MRRAIGRPLGALLLALMVAAAIIQATGGEPLPAFAALGRGAFGDVNAVLRTLSRATPLLFSGLAVAVGLRAGLFNIVVLTGLFAILSVGYLSRHHSQLHTYWGARGLLVAALCVALINLSNYHLTLLRSHGRIGAVSMWFVLQAGVGTALGLGLIPWLDAWGLLAGWLAGTALGVSYARAQGRGLVPIVPRASEDCGTLLRVGLPMYLYTASTIVMRRLDSFPALPRVTWKRNSRL